MSESFAETGRTTKIGLFASSVLGLIVGLATGVPEGKTLAVRLFALRTTAIERELAAFSAAQFQHADAEHARQAVLQEIRALEALRHRELRLSQKQRSREDFSQDHALYIAYARLAIIEEAAGAASAANAALAKAAEQRRALDPASDITPEQVKQAVRDFDNQAGNANWRY